MTTLPGVITQKVPAASPPGTSALDYDDCAVYATLWSAKASRPDLPTPTLTAFRAAAGNPDDPWTDGLYDSEVWAGVQACYPTAGATHYVGPDWDGFAELVKAGWIASLAVVSGLLPFNVRFGFYGRHRIGVAYEDGGFVVANPLAAQGSAPIPCSGTTLRAATLAIGGVFAVLFPPPIPAEDPLMKLPIASSVPVMVNLTKGDQIYNPDGSALVAMAGTGTVLSPYAVTLNGVAHRVLPITTGGVTYLALVRASAVTTSPVPSADTAAAFNEGRDAVLKAGAAVPRR